MGMFLLFVIAISVFWFLLNRKQLIITSISLTTLAISLVLFTALMSVSHFVLFFIFVCFLLSIHF